MKITEKIRDSWRQYRLGRVVGKVLIKWYPYGFKVIRVSPYKTEDVEKEVRQWLQRIGYKIKIVSVTTSECFTDLGPQGNRELLILIFYEQKKHRVRPEKYYPENL